MRNKSNATHHCYQLSSTIVEKIIADASLVICFNSVFKSTNNSHSRICDNKVVLLSDVYEFISCISSYSKLYILKNVLPVIECFIYSSVNSKAGFNQTDLNFNIFLQIPSSAMQLLFLQQ